MLNDSQNRTYDWAWLQYWSWVEKSYNYLKNEKIKLEKKYRFLNLRLEEARHEADFKVLKYHDIVGLTTTCAAKLQSCIINLKAPIGILIFYFLIIACIKVLLGIIIYIYIFFLQ